MSKIKFILPLFLLAAPACDDAAKDAKDGAKKAAGAAEDGAKKAGEKAGDATKEAGDAAKDAAEAAKESSKPPAAATPLWFGIAASEFCSLYICQVNLLV